MCAAIILEFCGCGSQMCKSPCGDEYFGYSLTFGRFDLCAQNLDEGSVLHITEDNVKDFDVYEVTVPPCRLPTVFTSQKICVVGPLREIVGVQAIKRCLNDDEVRASYQSIVNYLVREKRLDMNKNGNGCRAAFSKGGITVTIAITATNEIVVMCANEQLLKKYNIHK